MIPLRMSQAIPAIPNAATVVSGISVLNGAGPIAAPRSTVVVAPQMLVKTAITSSPVAGYEMVYNLVSPCGNGEG